MGARYRLLGRLEVVDAQARPVDLGGAQPRTLLAMLLVAGGRVVPTDAIVDVLWGDSPPTKAVGTLQGYVSRLRRALEQADADSGDGQAKRLVWEAPGYRLQVEADDVDASRFERLAADGRAALDAGRAEEARDLLVQADELWHGPALLEFREHDFAMGVATRLEERRLVALEDRLAADLQLGRHGVAAAELAELVAQHPLREGLRAQLALALYRGGRQAEALRALEDARRTLGDELGIDPSRRLRELETAILNHDAGLDLPSAPAAIVAPQPAPAPVLAWRAPTGGRLVGRGAELGQLVAAVEAVSTGARMAVVEGEPGIGKTRLVEELAAEASRRGAAVVWGRCYEGSAAPAFWPWLAALRSLVALSPSAASGELDQLLAPAGAAPSGANRFDLYEAVGKALVRAADEQPVVVVLDDLQWADEASLELVRYLAGMLDDAAVLVVVTVRELALGRVDAVVDTLAALARRPTTVRLRLRGLDAGEVGDLLASATGHEVAADVATAIHGRAEGNPFYAIELARLLDDGGGLDDAGRIAEARIPAGVRDVLRQRVARLPEATVELLRVAAVIGRDVDLGLLTQAAGRDPETCLDDLEPAAVHRLLVDVPDRPAAYRFTHALVREVLVEDLPGPRRLRIHRQVADAIEALGGAGDDDDAEILAEHLWAAAPLGLGARAAAALERAAGVAVRRSAWRAAEDLLERATRLRRAAPGALEDLTAELDALGSLLAIRRAIYGHQAILDTPMIPRLRELAERTGRVEVLARVLWAEWAGLDTACDPRATSLAEELRDLAATTEEPVVQVMGLQAWGITCWHRGQFRESADLLDRASALAEAATLPTVMLAFEQEQGLLPRPFAVYMHLLLGDQPDAREQFDRLASVDEPFARCVVRAFAASGSLLIGEFEWAAEQARLVLDDDPDVEFAFWTGQAQMSLGCAMALTGSLDEGLVQYEAGLQRFTGSGAWTAVPEFRARAAQALARAGRFDEAAAMLEQARAEVDALRERQCEPVVLAVDAELRHLRGDPEPEVVAMLSLARRVAADQGSMAQVRSFEALADELGLTLPPR